MIKYSFKVWNLFNFTSCRETKELKASAEKSHNHHHHHHTEQLMILNMRLSQTSSCDCRLKHKNTTQTLNSTWETPVWKLIILFYDHMTFKSHVDIQKSKLSFKSMSSFFFKSQSPLKLVNLFIIWSDLKKSQISTFNLNNLMFQNKLNMSRWVWMKWSTKHLKCSHKQKTQYFTSASIKVCNELINCRVTE